MIRSLIIKCCLVIYLIILPNNYAHSAGAIIKIFQGIGKFFGKNIDETTNIIKQSDESITLNKEILEKPDEILGLGKNKNKIADESIFNKADEQISSFDTTKVTEIKGLKQDKLLEMHGIKHGDKIIDLAETTQEFFDEDEAINVFRIVAWIGRVFRVSNVFNQPKEERIVIKCETKFQEYYFTADLSREKKWLLLSGNIINNKKQGFYSPQLKKQNLYVLADKEEYLIFSTMTHKGKKYPTNYFIINKDGFFVHEKNIYGTESPNYIIINAQNKISKSIYKCKKMI